MKLFGLFDSNKNFITRLEQNQSRLHRLALSWCHNRTLAEDLAQETLSKAIAKSAQLRDLESMESWLFGILANCLNDHYRRYRDTVDIDDVEESHFAAETTPEDHCQQGETVLRVRKAIAKLPVGQRQVVTLVDLEELAYAEVANILGIPVGTVMSRLCRARLSLKEMLLERKPLQGVTNIARFK